MKEKTKINKKTIIYILCCIYVLVLFTMHLARIFDNNFWGDEAFSIIIVRKSWFKMIRATARDVHPPLYYSILMIGERLLPGCAWMYHLVSVIAYGIMIVVAMTLIQKKYGMPVALLFVTMASLSDCAVFLNLEVRMYTWAGLFVLMAYFYMGEIIRNDNTKYYVLFVVFSLSAAYTHYYALVSVAFLYIVLLVWCVWKRNKNGIKKTLVCYVATVLIYLPWFIVLLKTFIKTQEDYWMTYIPSIAGSLRFLFELTGAGFDISKELEILFGLTAIVSFIYCIKEKMFDELFWLIAGYLSIGGTIMAGEFISHVFRPMYLEKYLYPVALVSWIILGINICKIPWGKYITLALIIPLLAVGIPSYLETYYDEMAENSLVEEFYSNMDVEPEQCILSDELGLTQAVLGYYYPESYSIYAPLSDLPDLDTEKDYWLFLCHGNSGQYSTWVESNGFCLEKKYTAGALGGVTDIEAYKIVKCE